MPVCNGLALTAVDYRNCAALLQTFPMVPVCWLAQIYPFHVEGLLAWAELQRALAHNEEAEDFLERAIYALEMAWPARVNPAVAHVSMSYNEKINRPLFRALFLHAQVGGVISKGPCSCIWLSMLQCSWLFTGPAAAGLLCTDVAGRHLKIGRTTPVAACHDVLALLLSAIMGCLSAHGLHAHPERSCRHA